MVIEFKPWWNKDNEYDMKKIQGFTDPNGKYKYKFGICIELRKDKGEISYCR